jgi:hypothetical protein
MRSRARGRVRWNIPTSTQPEQGAVSARQAVLTLEYQDVTLDPTRSDLRSKGEIKLWAFCASEEKPPAGAKRIEWFLLTTEWLALHGDGRPLHVLGNRCDRLAVALGKVPIRVHVESRMLPRLQEIDSLRGDPFALEHEPEDFLAKEIFEARRRCRGPTGSACGAASGS